MIRSIITYSCLVLFYLSCSRSIKISDRNDWENPEIFEINKMEPRSSFFAFENEGLANNNNLKSSKFIQLLNGIWKFEFSKSINLRSKEFYKIGYDHSGWDDITVPGHWELQGFSDPIYKKEGYMFPVRPPYIDEEKNSVGSYIKYVNIDAVYNNRNTYISFDGVSSAFYIWINGNFIGYSQASKNQSIFDITDEIKKGVNKIAIEVFKFSDGSYLENQNTWQLSGIDRNVYIFSRPKIHISDYNINPSLDSNYVHGILSGTIKIKNNFKQILSDDLSLNLKISDSKSTIFDTIVEFSCLKDTLILFNHSIKEVRSWSAEEPHLYSLTIILGTTQNKILEVINKKIGFRTVEIKNGVLTVNGNYIKVRGISRNEWAPIYGRVIDESLMIKDIKLMKENNINSVRSSYYPNQNIWYDLCDEYGLYVFDEANIAIEGLASHPRGKSIISDNASWQKQWLDRGIRMVESRKNHCSVITWSIGNNTENGVNSKKLYEWIKKRDSSRPVLNQSNFKNSISDIYYPKYKDLNFIKSYSDDNPATSLILSEYMHATGNSLGGLADFWDIINSDSLIQGGFISSLVDHTIKTKNTSDDLSIYNNNDSNLSYSGVLDADRKPHPHMYELKKVYQPIKFEPYDLKNGLIKIKNLYDFLRLDHLEINYKISSNNLEIMNGSFGKIGLNPKEEKTLIFNLYSLFPQPNIEYFLKVEAILNKDLGLLKKGHMVAWEQFLIPIKKNSLALREGKPDSLKSYDKNDSLIIVGKDFRIIFDKLSGLLSGYNYLNKNLITSPVKPNFWRAMTDNDLSADIQNSSIYWKDIEDSLLLTRFFKIIDSTSIKLFIDFADINDNFILNTRYEIFGDGLIHSNLLIKSQIEDLPILPRFGVQMSLDKSFKNLHWFGRGPHESYWDRKSSAPVDYYYGGIDDQIHTYSRLQESGNKTDIRWLSLNNKDIGLMIFGNPLFEGSTFNFPYSDLFFSSENNKRGNLDIIKLGNVHLNIDFHQMGVGGSSNWGDLPLEKYQLSLDKSNLMFKYSILPFSAKNKPINVAKKIINNN